jgi:Tol biopolymer transport system component
VSYPGGVATKVTNDLDDYFSPTLTADSLGLVSTRRSDLSDIWVASAPFDKVQRVTAEGSRAERPSWTSDGRLVYESHASGNLDVWIMKADGSGKMQLTFDATSDHSPSASPRSNDVYFVSHRSGVPHIWRMGTDGSNPTQVTGGEGELSPDCSPDGAWVAYQSLTSGRPLLWKISTAGGAPVQLTRTLSRSPVFSPDGKRIALYHWDEHPESPIRLAIISSATGEPVKSFEFPGVIASQYLRWSPDGQAVTYVVTENGISNIWSQPLDGRAARPVTEFGADVITYFDWSPSDGRLAFSRRIRTEDVVLINAFR